MTEEIVIVDAVRTPVGRRGGGLAGVHSADLLAAVQTQTVERAGIDPVLVDQVIAGCVSQFGMQALNVARTAWLSAGLPISTGATTIDSQCGSSQQALSIAAGLLAAGTTDVVLACGVESMSNCPQGSNAGGELTVAPTSYTDRYEWLTQFEVIERIADQWNIERGDLDAFGARSQQRAARAWDEGRFESQVAPVGGVSKDEGLRATTEESLAKLRPILGELGRHTAGTSSQISDGAAAVLLTTATNAARLGLRARARVVDSCLVGSDPVLMLTGPIPATTRLLERTGMTMADIDLIEINEAFASVVLAWEREFQIDDADERVNPNGGAIAMGHPVGATGAILITKALHELERTDSNTALVTMCCGGGLGTGLILERM